MKKIVLLFLLISSTWVSAQEFPNYNFESLQRSIDRSFFMRSNPSLSPITFAPETGNFILPIVNIYATPETRELDMQAIAQARELQKKQGIVQMDFPQRQLNQIQSNTHVYFDQTNFNNRTNNDLNFYGRQTPDGGIKNEVYEDNRQPFINPFYRSYNSPYYYRRRSNSGSGFYFTR
ncbi:hypothetical protein [Mesonia maritima]|uniref:Uncharacterized protein n=1 Tax=Mesonia maritima TaxID=1793873 RepID=A0ABU1K728_9FLAO|nr:hypothetical protein [Mesonia maritima]MDR6301409.1 hypothetical protein [Mesonia maritima]